MDKNILKMRIVAVALFAMVLLGCTTRSDTNIDDTNSSTLVQHQTVLMDMRVRNITYKSVLASSDYKSSYITIGLVSNDGLFNYYDGGKTYFYLGDYLLGSVETKGTIEYIFPQDIMGVEHESGVKSQGVINLMRVLLSMADNNITQESKIDMLNDFDMKNASSDEVSTLLTSLGIPVIEPLYAEQYMDYHYNLLTKLPTVDELSHITTSLCIDINSSIVENMLSDNSEFNSVDVYMNDIYQGILTKDVMKSKYTLNIKLGSGTQNFDKARNFIIRFSNSSNGIVHKGKEKTLVVPSPMLGRWVDTISREVIYLNDEQNLTNYTFTDINLLSDSTIDGRYLLRAGLGSVNIFGTIKKLSTTDNTLGKIKMKIRHTESNITQEYNLKLVDDTHIAGQIISVGDNNKTLFVDGNSTHYIIPKTTRSDIEPLQVISGKNEIYIEEVSSNVTLVSLFTLKNVSSTIFDFGTLNISDNSVGFNIVANFKEGNDYLYYGYEDENITDKPITYTKTLEVCNIGKSPISATQISLKSSNQSIFKKFVATLPGLVGIEAGSCVNVPIEFAFNKPTEFTEVNLTISVVSGSLVWEDHKVIKVSNDTFVKLYFLSKTIALNSFIVLDDEGIVFGQEFAQDSLKYTIIPKHTFGKYKLVVTKKTDENPYLVTIDMTPNISELFIDSKVLNSLNSYEPLNNTYYEGGITSCETTITLPAMKAQTIALEYGMVMGYITNSDIDYFALDNLVAVTHKYKSFRASSTPKVASPTIVGESIIIPFNQSIDSTNLDMLIKVFTTNGDEVTGLTKSYNEARKMVTINYDATILVDTKYIIKLLAPLKGNKSDSPVLIDNQEWEIEFKKTNMVSSGQIKSYVDSDDGTYNSGTSAVQIRNNENSSVRDINTELVWQDDNDTQSIMKNYDNAVIYCNNLSTSASTAWRLPTRDELLSIVDYTQMGTSINSSFGFVKEGGKYITSTKVANITDAVWYVDFLNGTTSYYTNNSLNYSVRCVTSSSPAPTKDYVKPVGSDYVSDRGDSYLLWQDDATVAVSSMNWADAVTYCKGLNLKDENGIYTGNIWRLPNIKELSTIVNDTYSGTSSPAIYTIFDNTAVGTTDRYWSSTTLSSSPKNKWTIGFEFGIHDTSNETTTHHVRCVSRGGF